MCRRSDLQAYTKMKTDEIVNLNNTISRLKKQLETYEAESYAQETKKDYSLQVASQKTLEYGQVAVGTHAAPSSMLYSCLWSLPSPTADPVHDAGSQHMQSVQSEQALLLLPHPLPDYMQPHLFGMACMLHDAFCVCSHMTATPVQQSYGCKHKRHHGMQQTSMGMQIVPK